MNNKIFICSIVLLLFIFSALLCLRSWFTERPVKDISCSGQVSFYRGESALHLSATLRLMGERGTLHLRGNLRKDNTHSDIIDRSIDFAIERINNLQIWTSVSVTRPEADKESESLLSDWLAPFYLSPGKAIRVSVDRINLNSVLISDEFAPYFVCSE